MMNEKTEHIVFEAIQQLESGILIVNKEGDILIVNSSALRYLQLGQEKVGQDKNIFEIKELSTFANIYCELLTKKEPISRRRVDFTTEHGKEIVLGLNASLILKKNETIGAIFLFTDLIEIEKLQEEIIVRKQMEGVGELTSEIIHELRNPLSVISGMTEYLIGKNPDNQELVKNLKTILGETEQINLLIARFLSFSSLKEIFIEKQTTDYIIQTAIFLCSQIIEKYLAKIDVKEIPRESRFVYADSEKMAGALSNLIRVGILEQCGQDKIQIGISVYEKEKKEIVFRLETEGPVLPHSLEEKDLINYLQNKRNRIRMELSVVQYVALAHHGWFRCYKRQPKGIIFEIGIPVKLDKKLK